MTFRLSDRQLEEVRRGEAVSICSPDFSEPMVVCPQSEFSSVVLSVIGEVREQGGRVTNEELKEEIADALVRRVWTAMGEKSRDTWAKENPY